MSSLLNPLPDSACTEMTRTRRFGISSCDDIARAPQAAIFSLTTSGDAVTALCFDLLPCHASDVEWFRRVELGD
ncbi:hypothetical protein ACR8AL_00795 [Clavibacter sepedonicus]|uniref:hypothetical protein n=1 Tax=Clavibacter TaxID=1573 RepID=UPI001055AC60|nr:MULTISPECIES: hypothetical protein [Clavibacter]MBD5382810.1 hypothetical protein [Clavibacter sp.]UUK64814.1 hypothetical protein LRE50_11010 [Clavibacter sepedonicus]